MSSNPHTPLVSILIPVYNREHLIGQCLQSAISQTMSDLEVVVVDNASTDGTLAVCLEYARRDPRIKVFANSTNLGPVRNWCRCIEEAQGVYGKILFSDDLMAPDYLTKTLPFLELNDVGFVFTSAFVGEQPFQGSIKYRFTGATGIFPSNHFISMALFNGDLPVSPGGGIFRLSDLQCNLLADIPSPTIKDFIRHGAGPDLLIYLLTAADYPSIAYVHEPLSFFRAHAGSITMGKQEQMLNQCYRQARLWFAEQCLSTTWLKRLYAYEWKRERKETGTWALPGIFIRRYCTGKLTLSPLDVVSGLLSSASIKKGRRVLQTCRPKGRITR